MTKVMLSAAVPAALLTCGAAAAGERILRIELAEAAGLDGAVLRGRRGVRYTVIGDDA